MWRAVEVDFWDPVRVHLYNSDTNAYSYSTLFENALYASFPKRDCLISFGMFYKIRNPICCIRVFPVGPEEERDAVRAREKILYCKRKYYARSMLMYASELEVMSNTEVHGNSIYRAMIAAMGAGAVRPDVRGGFAYENPEFSDAFSKPVLAAVAGILNVA